MKSIITDDMQTCYLCGGRATEKHHCMHGYGNRKLAERYGLTVGLCHFCHNEPPNGVHYNAEVDNYLKREAQKAFEARHSHKLWQALFMRNYL